MAKITLKGNQLHTSGELPAAGANAPGFSLVNSGLELVTLANYEGQKKVLNIFPSIDTPICAMSVRRFNEDAASIDGAVVLNISADLPFAHKRFCGAEGIANVECLSTYRKATFATDYGVEIIDGPLAALCARAVVVLDADNTVIYTELVPEIGQEPNYAKALEAIRG